MLKIYKKILSEIKYIKEISEYYIKGLKHSRELRCVQNNTKSISKKDIVLFCTLKNEAHRIDFFLDYYRKLGVRHFVLVDNGSSDGLMELLGGCEDVSVFYTEGSYKESNFGMHWLNFLLWKYGVGRWCLTCDPDEFLVYPYMDSRDLYDLTDYLGSVGQESFFAPMIDMYSDGLVSDTYLASGQSPLSVCRFFDAASYTKQFNKGFKNFYIQGGVRQRVFSKERPEASPALNKVPLIKWNLYSAYVSSMHMAIPRRFNNACAPHKTSGALLHFKFIGQLQEKVAEELVSKQHYNDSAEYKLYGKVIDNQDLLYADGVSAEYKDWRTLLENGFINKGEW